VLLVGGRTRHFGRAKAKAKEQTQLWKGWQPQPQRRWPSCKFWEQQQRAKCEIGKAKSTAPLRLERAA
jgi:hypothetical protein